MTSGQRFPRRVRGTWSRLIIEGCAVGPTDEASLENNLKSLAVASGSGTRRQPARQAFNLQSQEEVVVITHQYWHQEGKGNLRIQRPMLLGQ